MKKALLFLAIVMMAMAVPVHAQNYDYSEVVSTGQTLYFTLHEETTMTVHKIRDSASHNQIGMPTVHYHYDTTYRTDYYAYVVRPYMIGGYGSLPKPTGNLVIPSSITVGGNSYTVKEIEDEAFLNCDSLTSVSIPSSINNIYYRAFKGCTGLTSVNIRANIGDEAFADCSSLTSLTMSNGVTSIGSSAFSNCSSITSLTIPNSVTSIGSSAFSNCSSLTSLTIPNGVTSIGSGAFQGIRNIQYYGSATYGATDINWGALTMNGYYDGDYWYSDNTKSYLLEYWGTESTVIIPSTVDTIADRAFENRTDLTSLKIMSAYPPVLGGTHVLHDHRCLPGGLECELHIH